MLYKRRSFLQKLSQYAFIAGGTALLPRTLNAKTQALIEDRQMHKLTILHTNDVHSRIEPFPNDGGKYAGKGGVAKRAALIKKIREEEKNVLLLDCGDMFQGTPYFNYFGGELEIKLMSQLGYDAGTIGNHDFDAGIENLEKQLDAHANFPLINCNYDFRETVMAGKISKHKVIQKGSLKIGLVGVGVELNGLVPEPLFAKTKYEDPIEKANAEAAKLKHDYNCDYVICLSHLGYKYDTNKVSDIKLAENSKDINLILGGHTHTLLDTPTVVKNTDDKEVLVSQAHWAGIILGRLDIYFERGGANRCVACNNLPVE